MNQNTKASGGHNSPQSEEIKTDQSPDVNWVRLPAPGQKLCGLTRSYVHLLAKAGTIRSVMVRQRPNTRGVRLIWKPSVFDYLAKLDAEQNAAREA